MRDLSLSEINSVNGAIGLLTVPAAIGLMVFVPTIVAGATLPIPIIGPAIMLAGIAGTVVSGTAMVASILI